MAKTEKGHGNGVNESETTDTFGILWICDTAIHTQWHRQDFSMEGG